MKFMLLLIISFGFVYGNAVYSISQKEYNDYKSDPIAMLEKFKEKFLFKKAKVVIKNDKKKIITKKVLENKPKTMYKNVSKTTIKDENKAFYSINEVRNKLKYNKLLKENMPMLLKSIEKILKQSTNRYDTDEINLVLNQIHKKRVSPFESKIYLKQITNLLKGIQ